MRRSSLALFWGPLLSCGPARAEEAPPQVPRPVVAVLFLEDRTGDPEHASWRAAANVILSGKLASVKAIRLLSDSAAKRAFQKTGLRVGQAVDVKRAREIGEFLEAQRIVFGFYEREGSGFRVAVRVLKTASGTNSGEMTASGDWFDICERLALEILREVRQEPSAEEREQMKHRWTSSSAALRSIADAYLAKELDEPFSVPEAHVRKALEADPACARAHVIAAALAGTQGILVEAETSARAALRLEPSSADAHRVLGHTLVMQGRLPEALIELREARRLDPDDPDILHSLSWSARNEERVEILKTAAELDRSDSSIHATLAQAYIAQGERANANEAMLDAERYYLGLGGGEAQQFFLAYYRLGDAPRALKHFEHLRKWASRTGANPEKLRTLESMAERLRATLTPVAVEVPLPRKLDPGELESAFRQRVDASELPSFADPLAGGPPMKERAEKIAAGRQGEMEIARALHDALVARGEGSGEPRRRTALEALAAWDDPKETFVCDDNAKLYTALAREAGLDAFYAFVEKDSEGRAIIHACSAVRVDGKVYLADPTYRWFGAPHRSFQVLDDVQAAGAHVLQGMDATDTARARLATRLWPESVLPWVCLSSALIKKRDWSNARQAMETAVERSPEHWMTYFLRGLLADHDGDLVRAETLLRIAATANETENDTHYALADVLIRRGKPEDAIEALRAGIRAKPTSVKVEWASRLIAQLQDHLTSGDHLGEELEALRRRASALEKLPIQK